MLEDVIDLLLMLEDVIDLLLRRGCELAIGDEVPK